MTKAEKYSEVGLLESTLNEIDAILAGGLSGRYFDGKEWRERQRELRSLKRRQRDIRRVIYAACLLRDADDPAVVSLVSGARRDS